MGFLTPFIVLIERRLLRPLLLVLVSAIALVSGLGVHAGGQVKHRKTARDLEVAAASPVMPGHRWVKLQNGRRMVEAVIVGQGTDTDLSALRKHITSIGGTVNARFGSINALLATVPASDAAPPSISTSAPNSQALTRGGASTCGAAARAGPPSARPKAKAAGSRK